MHKQETPEWQEIGTAPRDGTRILVSDGKYVCEAFWGKHFLAKEQREVDAWWTVVVEDGYYNECVAGIKVPRAWMPLPSPPKTLLKRHSGA